jgi:hypothetical protein
MSNVSAAVKSAVILVHGGWGSRWVFSSASVRLPWPCVPPKRMKKPCQCGSSTSVRVAPAISSPVLVRTAFVERAVIRRPLGAGHSARGRAEGILVEILVRESAAPSAGARSCVPRCATNYANQSSFRPNWNQTFSPPNCRFHAAPHARNPVFRNARIPPTLCWMHTPNP